MSWASIPKMCSKNRGKTNAQSSSNLTEEKQITEIVELSHEKPQFIIKHSTRCSISSMAKDRVEREWILENVEPWYLALIEYRNVSNAIVSQLGVLQPNTSAVFILSLNRFHLVSATSMVRFTAICKAQASSFLEES